MRPEVEAHRCEWCNYRPPTVEWGGRRLCRGCWLDLSVGQYLREWRERPDVAKALTYKGVPLAATFEYDLFQELIASFLAGDEGTAEGDGAAKDHPREDRT